MRIKIKKYNHFYRHHSSNNFNRTHSKFQLEQQLLQIYRNRIKISKKNELKDIRYLTYINIKRFINLDVYQFFQEVILLLKFASLRKTN
mgnify:CR=1 FL=1